MKKKAAARKPTARRALAQRGTEAEEAATEQWMQEAEEARLAEAQVAQGRAKGKVAEEAASHAAAEKERVSRPNSCQGGGKNVGVCRAAAGPWRSRSRRCWRPCSCSR